MRRVFTDFQAVTPDELLFILKVGGDDLEKHAEELGLRIGDKVLLDAHEDFEVIGTLDITFVNLLGRTTWVARPDWSTRADKRTSDE